MEGWIKIHRKVIKWEWYTYPGAWHLFEFIILSANYERKRWRGQAINRGQLITSRAKLAEATGLSGQKVRTVLKKLESTGELKVEATNHLTKITVCNYESYQLNDDSSNQPTTNQQPTNNQPTTNPQPTRNQPATTTKEVKKDKEIKEFKEEVHTFSEKYSSEMLEEFISYWTEPNKSKTKLRFQLQQTWDTSRRLATWAKREFNKPENKNLYPGYTETSNFD